MSLSINLKHLKDKNLSLAGQALPAALEIESLDELIHLHNPLYYKLEAQKLEHHLLVEGSLELTLDCECSRCLKPYPHLIRIDHWICHIPLQGEEKALIINDSLDLTPYVREDIVLAFPQHPLCKPECSGLSESPLNPEKTPDNVPASAWAELNKLKFEE